MKRLLLAFALIATSVVPVQSGEPATAAPSTPVLKVSAGADHTCATTGSNFVKCWGNDLNAAATAPSDLGRVSDVSVGVNYSCSISTSSRLRCWGDGARVPTGFQNLSIRKVSVGGVAGRACAITTDDHLGCWGPAGNNLAYWQWTIDRGYYVTDVSVGGDHTCVIQDGRPFCEGGNSFGQANVPMNLRAVNVAKSIAAGTSHTCVITSSDSVQCWGSGTTGAGRVPDDLGSVRQISAGSSFTCAVTTNYSVRCWGLSNTRIPPEDLGDVSTVSAGKFHACAATSDGRVVCWGVNVYGQTTVPDLSAVEIPNPPGGVQASYDALGDLQLNIIHNARDTDGELSWKVVTRSLDYKLPDCYATNCKINRDVQSGGMVLGSYYSFEVSAKNSAGESRTVNSNQVRFCPNIPETITLAQPDGIVVRTGSSGSISGTLENFECADSKSVEYKSQESGKSWSKWTKLSLDSNLNFRLYKKFIVNTRVQFKASNGISSILSEVVPVQARIKTALPISMSWKSSYTKQRFSQGGVITIKFSGDREFSGSCVVSGETETAFNFALTYVGSESRFTTFKVQNGYGSGKLTMQWNGKVKVGALCSSPKYADVFDYRTPTLKANF